MAKKDISDRDLNKWVTGTEDLTIKEYGILCSIKSVLAKSESGDVKLEDISRKFPGRPSPTYSIPFIKSLAKKGYIDIVTGGTPGRFEAGHAWGDTIISLPGN